MRKLWITLPILFFVMYAESIEAKQNEIECLAQNIYHEARSESTAGRMAVALVTLNRVKDERFFIRTGLNWDQWDKNFREGVALAPGSDKMKIDLTLTLRED